MSAFAAVVAKEDALVRKDQVSHGPCEPIEVELGRVSDDFLLHEPSSGKMTNSDAWLTDLS